MTDKQRLALIRKVSKQFTKKLQRNQRVRKTETRSFDRYDSHNINAWTDASQYADKYYGDRMRDTLSYDNDWNQNMIPVMSGDRMNTYRVFQGEIDRMYALRGGDKCPPLTGIDILIMDYLKSRMREMEEKGHGWKDQKINQNETIG